MGWSNRSIKKGFVDYYLVVRNTDLVTKNATETYYKHVSQDVEPDMFVDKDNENVVDSDFWTPIEKEEFDEVKAETIRNDVNYEPETEDDEQIKVDWTFLFSYRMEKDVIKVRDRHLCVDCEHYSGNTGTEKADEPVQCDFRNGMYYYCKGYADLLECGKCKLSMAASKGKCLFHAHVDGVTGKVLPGDCSEWNSSGECRGFSERFDDVEP